MRIIQKPAGPKDQTWATILVSSLWFGQLSPITCEWNLCGQLGEFIAIKADKAEHERTKGTTKGQALARNSSPQSRLGLLPCLANTKTSRIWMKPGPGDIQGGGTGGVDFEWSNKHKRRQKCHFSCLPSKGSFEWGSLSLLGNTLKCFRACCLND